MDLMLFTVEEENLICAFDTCSRIALINGITGAMPDFEEQEMLEIAESTLRKLNVLTDAGFDKITFHPAYHGDDEDNEYGSVSDEQQHNDAMNDNI